MYKDVRDWQTACLKCAKASDQRPTDTQLWTEPTDILTVWVMDVQYMPPCKGFSAIVEARCEASGYLEAMSLQKVNSAAIARFIKTRIIYQHGCFHRLKVDGGPKNKGKVAEAAKELGYDLSVRPAYSSKTQGLIENGHKSIAKILMKMTNGTGKNWVSLLPLAVWADRTVVRYYGMSSYRLLYGREPLLPFELNIPTWRVLNWDEDMSHEALLENRVRMLQARPQDIEKTCKAISLQRRTRAQNVDQRGRHKMRPEPLTKEHLVLAYDYVRHIDMSNNRKLQYRWMGPYRISDILPNNRFKLKDITGIPIRGVFHGDRLKAFIKDKNGTYAHIDPTTDSWSQKDPLALSPTSDQENAPKKSPEQPIPRARQAIEIKGPEIP